jgi:hypothetical protein
MYCRFETRWSIGICQEIIRFPTGSALVGVNGSLEFRFSGSYSELPNSAEILTVHQYLCVICLLNVGFGSRFSSFLIMVL